jgi:hypothetical protein
MQKRWTALKNDAEAGKAAAAAKQIEADKKSELLVEQMMRLEPEKDQTSS